MKCIKLFKSKLLWLGVVLAICSGIGFILSQFELFEMGSTSMEPYIMGQGNPPTHRGDEVLIFKHVRHPLKRDDLVLVTMGSSNSIPTIRRVAGISGDAVPNTELTDNAGVTIQDGYYYLLGGTTNALDSRQLGLFSYDKISGKVVWVIRSSH